MSDSSAFEQWWREQGNDLTPCKHWAEAAWKAGHAAALGAFEKLRAYARHDDLCERMATVHWGPDHKPCSCGFAEALQAIQPAAAREEG